VLASSAIVTRAVNGKDSSRKARRPADARLEVALPVVEAHWVLRKVRVHLRTVCGGDPFEPVTPDDRASSRPVRSTTTPRLGVLSHHIVRSPAALLSPGRLPATGRPRPRGEVARGGSNLATRRRRADHECRGKTAEIAIGDTRTVQPWLRSSENERMRGRTWGGALGTRLGRYAPTPKPELLPTTRPERRLVCRRHSAPGQGLRGGQNSGWSFS